MSPNRSLSMLTLRFAGWAALLGAVALAACNRAPTPPEKLTIAPAVPGTTTGFAVLRQLANPDRNQEASDNRFTPTVSYVFVDRDSPEYYVIALLEKPVDNQKLAEANDPSDLIEGALRDGANGVVLMADGDGDVSGSFQLHAGGKSVQFGGSGSGGVRGLKRDGDRVSGHVHYFNSFFDDHMAIDASFDAPLLVPPKGTPMPPDGGEPAEAFLATVAAMRAGDVDKLVTLMAPERAKMIEAERGKPDFAENVEMLKAMAPSSVEVTGGTSYGERVVLTTKGKEGEHAFTGTVEMNWEAGGWRMGKQSTRMGGSGDDGAKADKPTEPKADEPPSADPVPVLVEDGAIGKGFRNDAGEFEISDGFVTTMPAEFGENRMLALFANARVEPKNASAMWDENIPIGKLFADGQGQPALWMNLSRGERGEISATKIYFVDAEGGSEDAYMTFNGIESGGKLIGTFEQSGSINEVQYEGVARFNLPVLPAP